MHTEELDILAKLCEAKIAGALPGSVNVSTTADISHDIASVETVFAHPNHEPFFAKTTSGKGQPLSLALYPEQISSAHVNMYVRSLLAKLAA